jgi:hypothetical protein
MDDGAGGTVAPEVNGESFREPDSGAGGSRSWDAGKPAGESESRNHDAGAPALAMDPEVPAGYVKGIIGVGYGGLRIVSRDDGLTWSDRSYAAPDGGDDVDLLRAVAYGKGRWIATGWKLMISDDGVNWDDLGMLNEGIFDDNAIIEGLAYHDGYFYAAGDGSPSRIYRSSDGVEWESYGEGGDTVKHTGLTYRDGLFVSYGDSETSYQSPDALHWTQMSGLVSATYCEGEFKNFSDCAEAAWFDAGFYLYPEWGGQIRRSTNGRDFETVYEDDQQNTWYRARAVAEGYVAP